MTSFRASRTATVSSAWALIAAVNGWALVEPPDHAGASLGARRFVTPAVTTNLPLAQTFRMKMPDLNGIDLRAEAVGQVGGRIRLELVDFDIDRGPLVIRSAEIDARALVQGESYTLQFEPVADSDGHRFRLDILSSSDAPSSGVGFWAGKGERYPDGPPVANERERWAGLAFQAHTPARSTLSALLDSRHLPHASGPIALSSLFIGWLALGVVLREGAKPDQTG